MNSIAKNTTAKQFSNELNQSYKQKESLNKQSLTNVANDSYKNDDALFNSDGFVPETIKLIDHAKNLINFAKEIQTNEKDHQNTKMSHKNLKTKKVSEVFEMNRDDEILTEDYLERLQFLEKLSVDIFSITSLLFYRVIWEHDITFAKKASYIKLFAACLWLAHKQTLDYSIIGKEFAMIVGFPLSSLKKMERVLVLEIFQGKTFVTSEKLHRFKKNLKISFVNN